MTGKAHGNKWNSQLHSSAIRPLFKKIRRNLISIFYIYIQLFDYYNIRDLKKPIISTKETSPMSVHFDLSSSQAFLWSLATSTKEVTCCLEKIRSETVLDYSNLLDRHVASWILFLGGSWFLTDLRGCKEKCKREKWRILRNSNDALLSCIHKW